MHQKMSIHPQMSFRGQFGRTKSAESWQIFGGRNMGASFKTEQEANASLPKRSQVIAFHSSAKWKIHFEASKQTSKLIVIDFTAPWCKPCQYMDPTINELAAKYTDVEFVKIDVDELDGVAQQFGVQAMPTFTLIKQGKEVDKVVGARRNDLEKKIEKHRI